MQLYLLHADNTFSSKADYTFLNSDGIPYDAPEGTKWVKGTPDGLEKYIEYSLEEKLIKMLGSLSDNELSDYAPELGGIKVLLDAKRFGAALLAVNKIALKKADHAIIKEDASKEIEKEQVKLEVLDGEVKG